MKIRLLTVSTITLFSSILFGCGGDKPTPIPPQPTQEEKATEALTGTGTQVWIIDDSGTVKKNNTDITALYTDFELQLNSEAALTYTSKKSNDLFDGAGTWEFVGSNFDKFIFSGSQPAAGKEISFTQTGDNLKLIFSVPDPTARINGIQALVGNYEFNLVKK